jgi:nucleoside-diphosphate-sugar epimerase
MGNVGKNILLTGATGYLGSFLLRKLVELNFNVIVVKRNTSSIRRIEDIKNSITFYDLETIDWELLFSSVKFDIVVHTAANYGRNGEQIREIFKANFDFPVQILSLAIQYNVPYFINTDTSLPKLLNSYSLSKKMFAECLNFYSNKVNVLNIVLEYFYGPFDEESKFITGNMNKMYRNVTQIDFTEGIQHRDFIYIDDVVSAFETLLNNLNSFSGFIDIPIGTSITYSLKEVVTLIQQLLNKPDIRLNFGAIPMRKGEILVSKADISLLASYGWEPHFSLMQGIKKIIEIESK